jgi:predicted GIY-YIG superfamily endonuclease
MVEQQRIHLQQLEAVLAFATQAIQNSSVPALLQPTPPPLDSSPVVAVTQPSPPFALPPAAATQSDDVIYVLKLAQGKWYVGMCQGRRMEQRLREHKNRVGSAWTNQYAVEELVHVEAKVHKWQEDNKTKEYMEVYGIDNVRGGTYAKPKLSADTIKMLTAEIRHNNGLCIRCGEAGHMMKQCRRTPSPPQDGSDDKLSLD